MIYLDHNATSPLRPEAAAAVARALEIGGNPSSVHAAGRAARAVIEDAREMVAAFVGATTGEVIFTSGGAEANALVLRGAIAAAAEAENRITRLFIQATAHDSVRALAASLAETTIGLQLLEIPVDASGCIDQSAFRLRLASAAGGALISLIYVNNETGVVEDIAALAQLIRAEAEDALIHVDGVSSGYCPVQFRDWDVDYLSASAHKIGGPQGAGALIAKDGAPLEPLFNGFQEMRRRGGTENVSGIAGFGAAAAAVQANRDPEIGVDVVREKFERNLAALGAVIFGDNADRASNTSCFAIPGLSAETALMALDLDGICVSSGAACSSGKVGRSHVLKAMGVSDDLARCALRVSFGWNSTQADADAAIASLEKLLTRISARKAA